MGGIGAGMICLEGTACFLQGYGEAAIDWRALTYYRYAWAVQDIAAWGEWAIFLPDLSEATRRGALHSFMSLFAPGSIVEQAFASESVGA